MTRLRSPYKYDSSNGRMRSLGLSIVFRVYELRGFSIFKDIAYVTLAVLIS